MTADEIRKAAEDRLVEVDAQLAALGEERVRLKRMLGSQFAPPTWEVPRVPLPGEQWPPAQPLRVEPYVPRVEPNSIPWGIPGVYGWVPCDYAHVVRDITAAAERSPIQVTVNVGEQELDLHDGRAMS